MRDLRNRLYAHLETLPLSFFTNTKTGEIQSRLQNDVGGVETVVTCTASTILANVVTFIPSIVAMIIISWQLTLVAVITVPAFFWLTKAVGDRRRQVSRSTQESLAAMSAIGLYASLYTEQFECGRVQWRCPDGDIMTDGTVRPREPHPTET